jgi:hypothetical protein
MSEEELFDPAETPPPRRKFKGKVGPLGKTAPEGFSRLDRQTKAVLLRRQGHTFREIAAEMKITLREAHRLVTTAFREAAHRSAETAEQMVQLHNERLDWMLKSLASEIDRGSSRAIEVAVKLLDRQARLLGLDAPAKKEVQIRFDQLSDQELLDEAKRLRVSIEGLTGGALLLPGETSLPPELEREIKGAIVDAEYTIKPPPPSTPPDAAGS